jgi:hypothetical protein
MNINSFSLSPFLRLMSRPSNPSWFHHPNSKWRSLLCNFLHSSITVSHIFFLWLYSPWRALAASHIGRFLELFRHMVGLLGRVMSPSQGLHLHRTTQHRKTRTNIHALRGIRTHEPSNQLAKTHASDRTATVTGHCISYSVYINTVQIYCT